MYIRGVIMLVSKWGNSLAIRIPAGIVETLKLKEGDNVEIYVEGTRSFAIRKSADTRELLERVRKLRGKLPEGFRFDRLKANER
jgi:antitoxin MazE